MAVLNNNSNLKIEPWTQNINNLNLLTKKLSTYLYVYIIPTVLLL